MCTQIILFVYLSLKAKILRKWRSISICKLSNIHQKIKKPCCSITPSSVHIPFSAGSQGSLRLIPAIQSKEWGGTPWPVRQSITEPINKENVFYTVGGNTEKTWMHWENMLPPRRKRQAGVWTRAFLMWGCRGFSFYFYLTEQYHDKTVGTIKLKRLKASQIK